MEYEEHKQGVKPVGLSTLVDGTMFKMADNGYTFMVLHDNDTVSTIGKVLVLNVDLNTVEERSRSTLVTPVDYELKITVKL